MLIRTLLVIGLLFSPAIALADIAPPPDGSSTDAGASGGSGGCAAAPGRSSGPAWALASLALGVGWAARRRR